MATPILDAESSGSQTYGVASITISHAVATQTNRTLLVWIRQYATTIDAVTGVTYNGVAMTRETTSGFGAASAVAYLYSLIAPATGTHDVVVTMVGTGAGPTAQAVAHVQSWYTTDQTTPIEQKTAAPTNNGFATSPYSDSLTSCTSGSMLIDMIVGDGSSSDPFVAGSGQTQGQHSDVAATFSMSTKTAASGTNSMSQTWASGSRQAGHIVASLKGTVTNSAPTYVGPNIGNIAASQSVAITPVNVSGGFSDPGDTLTYSASPSGTSWPTGLSINSSTGVISGTMATVATTTGIKVRATDTASQTVDSNAFNVIVSSAAPRTYGDTVYNANGTIAASVTLSYALLNGTKPENSTAILDAGTVSTNGSGTVAFSFPAAGAAGLSAGAVRWLEVAVTDGTPGQAALAGFGAPVTLA